MLPVPKVIKQLLLNTIYLLEGERERQWERDWTNLRANNTYKTDHKRTYSNNLHNLHTNTMKKPSTLREKSQRAHKSCGRGRDRGVLGSIAWVAKRNGNCFRLTVLEHFVTSMRCSQCCCSACCFHPHPHVHPEPHSHSHTSLAFCRV